MAEPVTAPPENPEVEPAPPEPQLDQTLLVRDRDEAKREAQRLRLELRKLSDAEAARSTAELTELEKHKKKIEELEASNAALLTQGQERAVRLTAVEVAARLGFRNPEVAYRLLDRSAIEYDEDGMPKNLEALLQALLATDSYLAKAQASGDFGGGNRGPTPNTTPDMNTLLRRAAKG